jgi:hypothetical protein
MNLSEKQFSNTNWVIACLLLLISLLRVASIVGPTILIALFAKVDGSLSLLDIINGFNTYINEVSLLIGINTSSTKTLMLYTFFSALSLSFVSPFLGLKKNVARIMVITLLGLELIIVAVYFCYTQIFPAWDRLVINIAIFTFLFLPAVAKKYNKIE